MHSTTTWLKSLRSIAISEVVDDEAIDVENTYRRLRKNRASQSPRAALSVVLDATLEVQGTLVYATFAVALVFFRKMYTRKRTRVKMLEKGPVAV